jgi:SulP family sulfate permease
LSTQTQIAPPPHTGGLWPLTRLDFAGAFGDIGVLFPIAIALISLNGMNPTAVFLAAGTTYILAAWYFRIAIAVQPFKAVAAIALALSLTPSAIASAGLLMGILLAVVGITNLAPWLAKLFTLPIVRGIQLGLGLLLVREGLRLIRDRHSLAAISTQRALAGWEIAIAATIILLLFRNSVRYPAALILLAGGIILGVFTHLGRLGGLRLGPLPLAVLHTNSTELWKVLPLLVIPQFALTFGNSIVATESTAQILYGPQARRVTIKGLTLSIALVNVISAIIQAAPMCHGSGGITAHYKFGARTAKSSYIIGTVCLLLAVCGRAALRLLQVIPLSVLGVFLVYVGIQHAAYLRDLTRRKPLLLVAICVGLVSLLTTNLMWGFLVGFGLQVLLSLKDSRKLAVRSA